MEAVTHVTAMGRTSTPVSPVVSTPKREKIQNWLVDCQKGDNLRTHLRRVVARTAEVLAGPEAAWHGVLVSNSSLRYRRARRTAGLSGLVAILALSSHASGNAAEDRSFPGLPRFTSGAWTGATQGGISEAAKARQWAQVPIQVSAGRLQNADINYPPPDPLGRIGSKVWTLNLFFVSPAGSEHKYGMSPKFTVRTVAFGAIPVEATLQLLQRREPDGLPVPIVATSGITFYDVAGTADYEDTLVEDDVTLRVTRLVVDGVDLGLVDRCRTAKPGRLSLFGKGWNEADATAETIVRPWEEGRYFPSTGGVMNGSVDIPPFGGCVTAGGEDVSRLLTSAVSGPDNAVKLNVSGPICGNNAPPPPGTTKPDPFCTADYVPPQIPIP